MFEKRNVARENVESRKPAGYRKAELEEDEIVKSDDPLADYEDFADPGDTNPDDRRRDPLRH